MSNLLKIVGLLILSFLSVQVEAQVSLPNVSAASLSYGKYADIPVNHTTGTAGITVPIHTVSDGPLSIPVALQYHTAGNYVQSPASNVGLGWNFNAGGIISRVQMGSPDEEAPYGYYHNQANLRRPSYSDDNSSDVWLYDSEPDIFTYSFAGVNGKFYIDANRDVQMIPRSGIKVEILYANDVFEGFVLVSTDGIRYHFGKYYNAQTSLRVARDISPQNGSGSAPSAWHLMAVTSPDENHWIQFNYEEIEYRTYTAKVCQQEFKYRKRNGNIDEETRCGWSSGGYNFAFLKSMV